MNAIARNPRDRRRTLVAALAWLLAGVGQGALASTPPDPDAPFRVMPLGDSITRGRISGTNPNDEGYRGALYKKIKALVPQVDFVGSQVNGTPETPDRDHEGHTSWTIDNLLKSSEGNVTMWLPTYQPDLVFLMAGTNDARGGTMGSTIVNRMRSMLKTIFEKRPRAAVVLATIPLNKQDAAADQRVRDANRAFPALVKEFVDAGRTIALVDVYGGLTGNDFAGLHPNQAGYAKIADIFFAGFKAVYTEPTDPVLTDAGAPGPMDAGTGGASPTGSGGVGGRAQDEPSAGAGGAAGLPADEPARGGVGGGDRPQREPADPDVESDAGGKPSGCQYGGERPAGIGWFLIVLGVLGARVGPASRRAPRDTGATQLTRATSNAKLTRNPGGAGSVWWKR